MKYTPPKPSLQNENSFKTKLEEVGFELIDTHLMGQIEKIKSIIIKRAWNETEPNDLRTTFLFNCPNIYNQAAPDGASCLITVCTVQEKSCCWCCCLPLWLYSGFAGKKNSSKMHTAGLKGRIDMHLVSGTKEIQGPSGSLNFMQHDPDNIWG